jgi:hypothetical protein
MVQPEYRYIGVDILTHQVIEDLPLYGISLTRKISGSGQMTGSFKLHTNEYSDADLISATSPGLRALFVLRNSQCIWAGPIWSRTYNSEAAVCEMTGQTFESVFAKIKMQTRFDRQNVDQLQVFKGLIDTMQTQTNSNFGFDTSGIGTSGVNVNLTVETWDEKMYEEPIDDLLKAAGSFDYIIDYTFDINTNAITLPVRVGYPMLGWGQPGIDLDYPGTVPNYYYPENAAKGAVSQTNVGLGEGSAALTAQWDNPALLAAGYPAWANVDSSTKSIGDQGLLNRVAQESGQTIAIPVVIPTVSVKLGSEDDAVEFGEWGNLGVPINLHIQDERFPDGIDLRNRMLGWSLAPPTSQSVETLSLVFEGQDSG